MQDKCKPKQRNQFSQSAIWLVAGIVITAIAALPAIADEATKRTGVFGVPLPKHAVARIGPPRELSQFLHPIAEISPDGKTVALQRQNGTVALWHRDTHTYRQVSQVPAQAREMRFSHNGEYLAIATLDESARRASLYVIDLPEGMRLQRWQVQAKGETRTLTSDAHTLAHSNYLPLTIAFSPDNERIAMGGDVTHVWDIDSGKVVRKLDNPVKPAIVASVSFAADRDELLIGTTDGLVRRADLTNGAHERVLSIYQKRDKDKNNPQAAREQWRQVYLNGELIQSRRRIQSDSGTSALLHMVTDDEGKVLVTGDSAGNIAVWTLPDGKLKHHIEAVDGHIEDLVVDADAKTAIARASEKDRFMRWDISGAKPKALVGAEILVQRADPIAMSLAADGRVGVILGYRPGNLDLFLWRPGDEYPDYLLPHQISETDYLRFGRDGAFVLRSPAWSLYGHDLWHVRGGAWRIRHRRHIKWVGRILPEGWAPVVFWGKRDDPNMMGFYNVVDGRTYRMSEAPDSKAAAYMRSRQALVMLTENGQLECWSLLDQKRIWRIKLNLEIESNEAVRLDVSPDGEYAALMHTMPRNGRSILHVFDAKNGERAWNHRLSLPATHPLFTPDSQQVLASTGRGLAAWKTRNARKIAAFPSFGNQPASALAVTPDGLVIVSNDDRAGTIYVYEMVTGRLLGKLTHASHQKVQKLTVSRDGRYLASSAMMQPSYVWDLRRLGGSLPAFENAGDRPTIDQLVAQLRVTDPKQAWPAMRALAKRGEAAVKPLREQLAGLKEVDQRITDLIDQLDATDFKKRESAHQALARYGERARPALERADAEPSSLEMERRVNALLEQLNRRQERNPGEAALLATRGVRVLSWINSRTARHALEHLVEQATRDEVRGHARHALQQVKHRSRDLPFTPPEKTESDQSAE